MLILTRRVGESIRLGEEIEIQIRAIEGNKVTMAILSDRIEPLKKICINCMARKKGVFFELLMRTGFNNK